MIQLQNYPSNSIIQIKKKKKKSNHPRYRLIQ